MGDDRTQKDWQTFLFCDLCNQNLNRGCIPNWNEFHLWMATRQSQIAPCSVSCASWSMAPRQKPALASCKAQHNTMNSWIKSLVVSCPHLTSFSKQLIKQVWYWYFKMFRDLWPSDFQQADCDLIWFPQPHEHLWISTFAWFESTTTLAVLEMFAHTCWTLIAILNGLFNTFKSLLERQL